MHNAKNASSREALDVSALTELYATQSEELERLDYHPYTMYNPLSYAFEPFRKYLHQCNGAVIKTIYFGMNPGPWGMAQTGVPFGDIESVTSWMGIHGSVGTPKQMIKKRPIVGYTLTRREVSGKRLWGFFAEHYTSPARFFSQRIVLNYCPLLFFDEHARNITPNLLHKQLRSEVESICDRTLRALLTLLQPTHCIAIGVYVHKRLECCISNASARQAQQVTPSAPLQSPSPRILRILHPSPANPQANKNWAERCAATLNAHQVL